MPDRLRRTLGTSVVMASLAVTTLSFAHAPPEGSGMRWYQKGSAEVTIVRTNRGFIFTDDGGKTFRMLCPYAFGATLTEVVPFGVTTEGRLLLGSYQKGLVKASSDLCTYEPVTGALSGAALLQLETIDSTPGGFAALTSTDDHLYTSADDAKTWTPKTSSDFLFTLRVSPTNPRRFYATALHQGDGGTAVYEVKTSIDGGATFGATTVTLTGNESGLSMLVVDAEDELRAYVQTTALDPEQPARLLRTDDGGNTLTEVFAGPGPFVMKSLPGVTWLGTREALMRSTDGGKTFTDVKDAGFSLIGCVEEHAGKLYVCGYFENEFGVRVSSDGGQTFAWFLRFPQVDEQVDCAGSTPAISECVQLWHDWQVEQGQIAGTGGATSLDGAVGGTASGGAPGTGGAVTPTPSTGAVSGADAGSTASRDDSGCGCRVEGTRAGASGALATVGALVVAWRRRRPQRRRSRC